MAFGTRKLNGSGSKHTARWGHREDVKVATKSRRRAEDKTLTAEDPMGERERIVAFMRRRIELWRRLAGVGPTEDVRRRWGLVVDQVALLADEIEDGGQEE